MMSAPDGGQGPMIPFTPKELGRQDYERGEPRGFGGDGRTATMAATATGACSSLIGVL